jgi:hypothetical protein
MSKFKLFESVALTRDLPEKDLRAGDGGAVVELYDDKAVEVEFFDDRGKTTALETIYVEDLRSVESREPKTAATD